MVEAIPTCLVPPLSPFSFFYFPLHSLHDFLRYSHPVLATKPNAHFL